MKFTRLKLTGFKSFCDPTDLFLEPGLTAVVGPNGCGKSNLVEALRWVMGESSYKAMRASGMDEVIFSGSAGRPGRNSAEVTVVLDNADRTAPAPLNTADVLEVTRRIEREQGSVYRVNGREVRARDVQLLFADASTGAHSPALVRQGQIGELIAAKPVQRRALLEEAAGISGLHSRRHEAELRLRAAEHNLERVDDVIAQVEQQLEALRRQARLAVRYRSLSGEIRKAEAALYHIRWVAARAAETETEAAQARLVRALADATTAERAAARVLEAADAAMQPARDREAAAGAALQRLKILREQLEDEIRRAGARRAELGDRHAQAAADLDRETVLLEESEAAIAGYDAERAGLTREAGAEQAESDAARAEAEAAAAALAEAEARHRAAVDLLSQLRAARAQAERSAADAAARAARLRQQIAEVEADARVAETLDGDDTVATRRAALEAAQGAAAEAERRAQDAETARQAAETALDAARPALAELETRLGRLESEAETLARVLAVHEGGLWPAVVDALTVAPGCETALGAALGDDLDASSDTGAPLHWAPAGDGDGDPPLPAGAVPLSDFVTGTPLLARRLRQVGLVEPADGPRMMPALAPGQRLVTRDGDLWRWDGFVAAADAPTAAAQRLAQRNRLGEIDAEVSALRQQRTAARAEADRLAAELDAARAEEQAARENWRAATRAIAEAQGQLDAAQRALGDLATRRGALEEARVRLASSLAEAEAVEADARAALAEADAETAAAADAETAAASLTRARDAAEQARLRLGAFDSRATMRATRLAQLDAETAGWQRRQGGARDRIATLRERLAEIAGQLAALDTAPDAHAEKRAALDDEIAEAGLAHRRSADALAGAQAAHREADRGARTAAEVLSEARAETARIDERLKGLIGQRRQIERLAEEALGVPADRTAEAAGIRPEAPLPQEPEVERRLDRLKAERERLGGVNLSAEREAEEVREKLDTMTRDRDELIEAISKLRSGIQSLNREGRARLTEAFGKVNAHFRELFTTLFGGGSAELSFVESDDPLEAGLEITARPPGKKPQTMTLLSGGEQALTALSLIFAVFLTNPAPVCVLDEVDAPLDDANVERFCNLLDSMCERTDTRFLVITHNPITMARMDRLYGVTMAERGVSQLVSVDLRTAHAVAEAV